MKIKVKDLLELTAADWAAMSKTPVTSSGLPGTNIIKATTAAKGALAKSTAAKSAVAKSATVKGAITKGSAIGSKSAVASAKALAASPAGLAAGLGAAHAVTAGLMAKKALEKPETKLKKLEVKKAKAQGKLGTKLAKINISNKSVEDKSKRSQKVKIKAKGKEQQMANKSKFLKHFVDKNESLELVKNELREYIISLLNEGHEEEPDDSDYVISSTGSLGSQSSVSQDGEHLGTFNGDDDAIDFIKKHMKKENFFPNIWILSDHGNYHLVTESNLQERRSLPAKLTAAGAIVGNAPGAALGYGIGRALEKPEDKGARKQYKLDTLKSKIATKKALRAIK